MDENNNATPTEQDFLAAFGIVDDTGTEEETPTEEVPTQDPESDPAPDDNPDGQGDDDQEQEGQQPPAAAPQNQQTQADKSNRAFAQLRTQNAALQKTVNIIGQVLGIDTRTMTPDQIAQLVQDQGLSALAQKNGVNPEIYKRLDQLEAVNAQYEQSQREQKAQTAFLNIMEKYKASVDDINAFVEDLIGSGYNMDAPGADIETEFVKRNFDKIVGMKVDEAVRAEQLRSSNGKAASKPDNKQGKPKSDEPEKEINTVAGLTDFLTEISK